VLVAILSAPALAGPAGLGFSRGEHPIDIGSGFRSAERCGSCHETQLEAWSASRHSVAHSNDIYQAGLVDEPSAFCVNCHSPLPEQVDEVLANLRWYAWKDPVERFGAEPERLPERRAGEGVTCAACHVRDGVVLGTGEGLGATHGVRETPELSSPELCAGCHEFRTPIFHGDTWTLTDVPMQSTYSEWQEWGGDQTCQDCHMPDGDHRFRGAHDRDFLVGSLAVEVGGSALTLRSVGVGHSLPTGDLFRNLTVEAHDGHDWAVVHRIGRRFEERRDPQTLGWTKGLVEDSSLRPGERRVVQLPVGTSAWRVRYHFGAEHDERRGLVPLEDLVVVLRAGVIPGPDRRGPDG
jgi:hypothetical protein